MNRRHSLSANLFTEEAREELDENEKHIFDLLRNISSLGTKKMCIRDSSKLMQNPIGMLNALQKVSDKIVLFCEAGPVSYTHLDVYKRQIKSSRDRHKQ